jgi:hypothetical protein
MLHFTKLASARTLRSKEYPSSSGIPMSDTMTSGVCVARAERAWPAEPTTRTSAPQLPSACSNISRASGSSSTTRMLSPRKMGSIRVEQARRLPAGPAHRVRFMRRKSVLPKHGVAGLPPMRHFARGADDANMLAGNAPVGLAHAPATPGRANAHPGRYRDRPQLELGTSPGIRSPSGLALAGRPRAMLEPLLKKARRAEAAAATEAKLARVGANTPSST